jgi:hypothetical protein
LRVGIVSLDVCASSCLTTPAVRVWLTISLTLSGGLAVEVLLIFLAVKLLLESRDPAVDRLLSFEEALTDVVADLW